VIPRHPSGQQRRWIGVVLMATAAFILSLHGCNVPSLRDLDIPPASGKSTLVLLPSLVNLTPGATFIFTASGGRPPYTFAPSGNFEVLNGGTTAKYTAPSAGTYIVSVTDADGYTTESTVMVTGSIPLSVSPSVVTVLAGSIVTLIASGGDGSYSFILLDGSGTLTQQTGEEDNKADYESAGAETATIEVVSASRHVYAWITSTTPSGTLQISPYAVSMTTGQELTFSAINATGTPTFSVVAGTGTIDPETGIFTAPPVEELGGIVRVTDDVGRSMSIIRSPLSQRMSTSKRTARTHSRPREEKKTTISTLNRVAAPLRNSRGCIPRRVHLALQP
jgi:microcystin-dependent protein